VESVSYEDSIGGESPNPTLSANSKNTHKTDVFTSMLRHAHP
jgi:hypothetical protein